MLVSARATLGPAIVAPTSPTAPCHLISLEPLLEQRMLESLQPHEQGSMIARDTASQRHRPAS